MEVTASETKKIAYLDGLRGVAAVMVFNGHLMISLLPAVITFQAQELHSSYDIAFGLSPLRVLFSGNFGVCVFFVLSGFVLSDFCLHTRISFPAQLVRRYFRLALPMLITSTFAWLLLHFHLYKNLDAASLVTKSGWLSAWYQFEPNFWVMAREALVTAFYQGSAAYNSNLWTMKIELLGSLYIFTLHVLFRNANLRVAAALLYIFLNPWSYFDGFFVGAILYDARPKIVVSPRGLWTDRGVKELFALTGFVAALWMGSFPEVQPGMTSPWHVWLLPSTNSAAWHMVGAAVMVGAMINSALVQKAFSAKWAIFLGKISFVLYLIHLPIICSLTAWIIFSMRGYPYALVLIVSSGITIAAVLWLSALVYKYADLYTTAISRTAGIKFDTWFSPISQRA